MSSVFMILDITSLCNFENRPNNTYEWPLSCTKKEKKKCGIDFKNATCTKK